jgi:hypothetical protein
MKKRDFDKVISKIKLIEGISVKEKTTNHYRFSFYYNDKFVMKTKMSFGSKIKSGDIKNIANDLHFRVDEIITYGKCNISNEEYLETLRARGYV